jgi:arylsulfatase A-like enzyme
MMLPAFEPEASFAEGRRCPRLFSIAVVWVALCLLAAGCTTKEESSPNVIVYLVDTLRAKSLGAYGGPAPVSTHIDAFAGEATVFARATAQSPWTRPSVASIFTGQWPTNHRVNARSDALPQDALTLAELLGRAGYQTAGFVTNGQVGTQFGFEQGFETFEILGETERDALHRLSDDVNRTVFEWIDRRPKDQPFFLYVHTMDPHGPYAPPAHYRKRFAPAVREPTLTDEVRQKLDGLRSSFPAASRARFQPIAIGSELWLLGLNVGVIPVTSSMKRDLLALYQSEIAFNDEHFGNFLELLRERGLYEDSIVVFASDHGEEFYEHGRLGHGKALYSETLGVPLLIRIPPRLGRDLDPNALAEHVDLLPTLLEAVGLPIPEHLDGESLFSAESRTTFATLDMDGRAASTITVDDWKLIRTRLPEKRIELFDLTADPDEADDRAAFEPERVAALLVALEEVEQRGEARLSPSRAVIDRDLRDRLVALGYFELAEERSDWPATIREAGVHPLRAHTGGELVRWTNGAAEIVVAAPGTSQALWIDIAWTGPRTTRLEIRVNDQTLFSEILPVGSWSRALSLDGIELGGEARIEILSDPFVPSEIIPGNPETNRLGVAVRSLRLVSDAAL